MSMDVFRITQGRTLLVCVKYTDYGIMRETNPLVVPENSAVYVEIHAYAAYVEEAISPNFSTGLDMITLLTGCEIPVYTDVCQEDGPALWVVMTYLSEYFGRRSVRERPQWLDDVEAHLLTLWSAAMRGALALGHPPFSPLRSSVVAYAWSESLANVKPVMPMGAGPYFSETLRATTLPFLVFICQSGYNDFTNFTDLLYNASLCDEESITFQHIGRLLVNLAVATQQVDLEYTLRKNVGPYITTGTHTFYGWAQRTGRASEGINNMPNYSSQVFDKAAICDEDSASVRNLVTVIQELDRRSWIPGSQPWRMVGHPFLKMTQVNQQYISPLDTIVVVAPTVSKLVKVLRSENIDRSGLVKGAPLFLGEMTADLLDVAYIGKRLLIGRDSGRSMINWSQIYAPQVYNTFLIADRGEMGHVDDSCRDILSSIYFSALFMPKETGDREVFDHRSMMIYLNRMVCYYTNATTVDRSITILKMMMNYETRQHSVASAQMWLSQDQHGMYMRASARLKSTTSVVPMKMITADNPRVSDALGILRIGHDPSFSTFYSVARYQVGVSAGPVSCAHIVSTTEKVDRDLWRSAVELSGTLFGPVVMLTIDEGFRNVTSKAKSPSPATKMYCESRLEDFGLIATALLVSILLKFVLKAEGTGSLVAFSIAFAGEGELLPVVDFVRFYKYLTGRCADLPLTGKTDGTVVVVVMVLADVLETVGATPGSVVFFVGVGLLALQLVAGAWFVYGVSNEFVTYLKGGPASNAVEETLMSGLPIQAHRCGDPANAPYYGPLSVAEAREVSAGVYGFGHSVAHAPRVVASPEVVGGYRVSGTTQC